jgi:lipopolysaccharide heptosyltransferase II
MTTVSVQRFLIIRLAGIGDVVMASALARRLRDVAPTAHIAWLCGTTAAPLVEQFADVDEVIAVNERGLLTGDTIQRFQILPALVRRLRAGRFSRVFLLHADIRYRVLTTPLTGVVVVSQSSRNAHGAMNPVPGRYMGDEFARLMDGLEHRGPIVGHFPLGRLKTVTRTDIGDTRRIALVPGGARNVLRESALKRWPLEHYADLARRLANDGCEIILLGNTEDAWVRSQFADAQTTDLIGRTTIPEMMRVLADCDLVVSHDTGPMHLARLVGAPLIALFGPTMPAQFIVPDELTTVLWGGEHLACRPCYDGREFAACNDNQCISSIGVDVVLRTARTLLRRRTVPIAAEQTQQILDEIVLR